MKRTTRIGIIAASMALALTAHGADFKLTITNLGEQPLSPLFYSASDNSFDIFQIGGMASSGIKKIAEDGDTSSMTAITQGAGSAVTHYGVLGASPLGPGATRSVVFQADMAHSFFSFAAMLGKTNDGFVGEGVSSMGLNLFSGGSPSGFDLVVIGARAWDAGTELNSQNAADLGFKGGSGNPQENMGDDHIRVHPGIIQGIGDSWAEMPSWSLTSPIAHLNVEVVPEPGTILAVASGLGVILARRRRA